jgi:hypothetical protein
LKAPLPELYFFRWTRNNMLPRIKKNILVLLHITVLLTSVMPAAGHAQPEEDLRRVISSLSSYGTRSTGTEGYLKAVAFIRDELESLGLETGSYLYELPVRRFTGAELRVDENRYQLDPFIYNAITPGATDGPITGPVYYVGRGDLDDIDGKDLSGSIALIDFDSERNWEKLASIGVRAAIFLKQDRQVHNSFYLEKLELTPLQFPCFIMDRSRALSIFGNLDKSNAPLKPGVELNAVSRWEKILAHNLYALIEGSDEQLKNQLVVIESFFDNQEFVAGKSPGADAATSIATMLNTAARLAKKPPARSVLLLATSGQAQTLAGMRDIIWSINSRSKDLRDQKNDLKSLKSRAESELEIFTGLHFPLAPDKARDQKILAALKQSIDFQVDRISRRLMTLRVQEQSAATKEIIKQEASRRFLYRKLGWATSLHNLPDKEAILFREVLPLAAERNRTLIAELDQQLQALQSAGEFRSLVNDHEVAAIVSLHLSSHGNGVGGFNRGWLYNLKQTINRTSAYTKFADVLEASSRKALTGVRYQDSLRPSHQRSWDTWLPDRPVLGGEVSALAGYLGLSLATTGDSRSLWGTQDDTVEKIDWDYLAGQAELVFKLLEGTANADNLKTGTLPRDGFVTVSARTNLLLQGELFANYPARGTTILAYQGLNKFFAQVDESGKFQIKGVADKKHVLDKLIIEGYRYDQHSGRPVWAIDKKLTGKSNYRLKLLRKSMSTDLVLFNCRETTIFNLLEPRNFNYMTKMYLFDGRRDAPPEHYWYSRIDTRKSIISSIYTEPGTLLKLTLSDTVLTNKMILTNGTEQNSLGLGYKVDDFPIIPRTLYHAARDSWTLLTPRINNLESHGIYDEKINDLKERGLAALQLSSGSYSKNIYSQGQRSAAEALAYAARVYVQIEKTQKDVLFGVLFYIALFVPFAFVAERFLFNFNTIYKRILGFIIILLLLISIIYNVHPAFDLAYSPLIVVLAFFIIGLSFLVTLIIFFRFEEEMLLLQRRASHKKTVEISRWKAFVAAFFLGVSNLRRRRIRSILTCTTLIILTFTIMSFTTIKSNQQQVKLRFQDTAPYHGLLLKQANWQSLPPQAAGLLAAGMTQESTSALRIWLENRNPEKPMVIPLRKNGIEIEIQGLIGLSPNETKITGLDKILLKGRWFSADDELAIILEQKMAEKLGVKRPGIDKIELWGTPYTVVGTFAEDRLEQAVDLNGEPLTPVIFPNEAVADLTEAEMDALESGDDIRTLESRYQNISANQTAIVPARTLLANGGEVKSIAVSPSATEQVDKLARRLSDRFSLAIFTGDDDGVWLYNISDTMNYSGVPNILIPLLISVFIVLNTMISSVYERKNEIAVYTSVGLAPSHVGFLFVAESMALAVISVVLGYLVAQISAAFLSETVFWQGITVNYSSMAGVAAMILVLGVVLTSVAYPARVAARIAIPDVNRTFSLPQPVDNKITVTLPFLMKYAEQQSIGGFIYEYFVSHNDVSHGVFSTGPVQVVFSCSTVSEITELFANNRHDQDLHCLHIRSNVWLAPFDFGILQTVDIQFRPAQEGEEFLEIKITLARQAGEAEIWRRINTAFLHEFRKQLLIWRSFDDTAHRDLERAFDKVTSLSKPATEVS